MHSFEDEIHPSGRPVPRRRRLPEAISFALAGLTLGTAVAFTGHYIGSHANARAVDDGRWLRVAVPAPVPLMPTSVADGTDGIDEAPPQGPLRSLARENDTIPPPASGATQNPREAKTNDASLVQRVARGGKGDLLRKPLLTTETVKVAAAAAVAFAPFGESWTTSGNSQQIPEATPEKVRNLLITASPSVARLEETWRLGREARRRILAARKRRLREQACLARAIYFEARSEGERGQMAVAQTILNRVRDPRFPNTICGVVYQGAEKRNACQFSFACDGRSDVPTQRKAWTRARRIAAKALKGRLKMRELEGVTFYHADYVRPRWASFKRRVTRIGRHIFYRDG